MSEPTIDEMLQWLWRIKITEPNEYECAKAIRAILEQHRKYRTVDEAEAEFRAGENRRIALEAIRAFVERVERVCSLDEYKWQAALDLLATMEKET